MALVFPIYEFVDSDFSPRSPRQKLVATLPSRAPPGRSGSVDGSVRRGMRPLTLARSLAAVSKEQAVELSLCNSRKSSAETAFLMRPRNLIFLRHRSWWRLLVSVWILLPASCLGWLGLRALMH